MTSHQPLFMVLQASSSSR